MGVLSSEKLSEVHCSYRCVFDIVNDVFFVDRCSYQGFLDIVDDVVFVDMFMIYVLCK